MRIKKRNPVVVLVLIALLLPALVACGGKEDAASPTTAVGTTSGPPATQPRPEREPCILSESGPLAGLDPRGQTVIWWHPYSGAREADVQAMVYAFNTSNACDITVVAASQGAALHDKMRGALATGEVPGLIVGNRNDQAAYALANGLADMAPYITDGTWGLSRLEREDFIGAFLGQSNGPHLGLPLTRTVDVLFYNQTWLAQLGFPDPPAATATFKDMACAATRARDATGYVFRDAASAIAYWTEATGGTILNNERTGYSYNNKAVIDAVTFLKELYDEGCADFRTGDSLPVHFAARRLLFAQGSSADIPAYKSALEAAGSADEWGVIAIPRDDAEPAQNIYGSDLMIPATNPETQLAAWIFLEWFVAPQRLASWTRVAEEFPARANVVVSLDVEALMPQWGQALALLSDGVYEPQLVSYPAVRELVTHAFARIVQGDAIQDTLSRLNADANALQKKALAEGVLLPRALCGPATSGPLAGVDPRGQTVTWWHAYSAAREADLHAMLDAFNTANPCGITVIAESQGNALHSRLDDAVGTGALPGLAVGDQHALATYGLAHALADMNAYITDEIWGLSPADRADFFPALLAQGVHPSFDGQRLGFPLARSVEVLFYNQTWLTLLRHSGPFTTTEAFETLTCAVAKARDAAETGASGYVLRDDPTALAAWAAAFGAISPAGGAALNARGDGYAYNTPAVISATTFLRDLYAEACITPTLTGTPSAHFAARRALFVLGSSADIPLYQRAMEAAENEDVWGVTTLPYSRTAPAPIVHGSDLIIPATNPETQLAAWIFLTWFTAPEQQTQWVRASGDFPTRASVAAQVDEDQFASQWFQALALLPYGVCEPRLISYPSARDAIQQTFNRILQGGDAPVGLNVLTRQINQLQERMQNPVRP